MLIRPSLNKQTSAPHIARPDPTAYRTGVNADSLNAEQRERLKRLIARHRDGIDRVLRRMRDKGWYTDDPVLNSLIAAHASLHAALNLLAVDGDVPDWVKRMG
jgi:hypothetical protein